MARSERWLGWASATIVAVAVVYLVFTIGEPLRTNWGDPWSDSNVQTSGRFFARDGFIHNAFTPTIDIEPLTKDALKYTHYPPLPDILNGVEQKIFGARDISFYRIFALAMSFAALAFFFRWVRRLWDRETALFGVALFASNLLFLEYADTIHHVPIYWSTGFGALAASAVWMEEGKRSALLACTVAVFVCFMASYDYYFFLPIALAATALVLRGSGRSARIRLLFGAVVAAATAAVVVKTLCVIWAVGARQLWNDFLFQFFERATARHADDYSGAFPVILGGRVWRFFGPLVILALGVQLAAAFKRRRGAGTATRPSPLFVLLAGVPFVAVFTQLFCEQYHPTLQFLPYYAVGVGALLAGAWKVGSVRMRGAALAGLALCGVWQIIEVVRLEKSFLERDDIVAVRKLLDATDHRRFVLSNVIVDAAVRNYWNRYSMWIPRDNELSVVRDMFDVDGHDGPITIIEFRDLDRVIYDKGMYPMFAGERRWNWIASPFWYRQEWRPRVGSITQANAESADRLGKVVYESKNLRVHSVTLAEIDAAQRKALPEGQTRQIDFETRWANNYKVYGFGGPEQYDRQHGFSWLQARKPSELVFTLKGLRPKYLGEPIKRSALRVRLAPGKDYRFVALGFTAEKGQTLSMRVNGSETVETISADAPDGPRDYVFHIARGDLHADGIQDLEFSYPHIDQYGNGVLFHTVTIDPVEDCAASR